MNPETLNGKEIFAEGVTEVSSGVEIGRRLIREVLDSHVELGRGNDGVVWVFAESAKQDFCVKELHELDAPDMINSLESEMLRQREAMALGVRSPIPIMCLETDEGSYMVMETIKGHSIRDIIEQHIPLPDNFNEKEFWSEAADMIEKLHNGQIYHRDIHPGNIMVDYVTGKPVIIDYGRAIHAFGDEDPYIQVDVRGRQVNFVDDKEGLRNTRLALSKYLTER